MHKITIAHSPDADDVFMYYAIAFGWVGHPFIFQNQALDIESLNQEALQGTFDISAISFALYPLIAHEQLLLQTGVSFGYGYGPKLIKKKTTTLRPNFKVALSGKHTTNALLFKIAYPKARIIYKNFLDIEGAVLSGEVDAGMLIHESILQYDNALCVERELWDIWTELNKQNLPLPLGGMCLRRSLPIHIGIACEQICKQAIHIALANQALISKMLRERNLLRVGEEDLKTYLGLYANEKSAQMDSEQIKALNALFHLGYEHHFYPHSIDANDCFIPHQYQTLRHQ